MPVLDNSVALKVLLCPEMILTQEVCFISEYFELSVSLSCGTFVLVNDSLHANWICFCLSFRWTVLLGSGFSCTEWYVYQWVVVYQHHKYLCSTFGLIVSAKVLCVDALKCFVSRVTNVVKSYDDSNTSVIV